MYRERTVLRKILLATLAAWSATGAVMASPGMIGPNNGVMEQLIYDENGNVIGRRIYRPAGSQVVPVQGGGVAQVTVPQATQPVYVQQPAPPVVVVQPQPTVPVYQQPVSNVTRNARSDAVVVRKKKSRGTILRFVKWASGIGVLAALGLVGYRIYDRWQSGKSPHGGGPIIESSPRSGEDALRSGLINLGDKFDEIERKFKNASWGMRQDKNAALEQIRKIKEAAENFVKNDELPLGKLETKDLSERKVPSEIAKDAEIVEEMADVLYYAKKGDLHKNFAKMCIMGALEATKLGTIPGDQETFRIFVSGLGAVRLCGAQIEELGSDEGGRKSAVQAVGELLWEVIGGKDKITTFDPAERRNFSRIKVIANPENAKRLGKIFEWIKNDASGDTAKRILDEFGKRPHATDGKENRKRIAKALAEASDDEDKFKGLLEKAERVLEEEVLEDLYDEGI